MAITRVGIHYSASQQVIRQIHHFDRIVDPVTGKWRMMTAAEVAAADENKLISHQQRKTKPGEVFTTMPHADYHSINAHQAVHSYLGLTGVAGVTDRHAVVDKTGNVVAVVFGDPAVDIHPAGDLVAHPSAIAGDKIVKGVFTAIASAPPIEA